MLLDRPLADNEFVAYVAVRFALGDQHGDLALAFGQATKHVFSGAARCRRGEVRGFATSRRTPLRADG